MSDPPASRPTQSVSDVHADGDVTIVQTQVHGPPLPLLPPFNPHRAVDDLAKTTLLGSMRAYERRVQDLVGRGPEISLAKRWLQDPAEGEERDHRVLVIHGPGGAGKTRLAAEILLAGKEEGWTAGFLSGNPPPHTDWAGLAHPSEPLLVAVDYAEARHDDLQRLFEEAPIGHRGSAPLRLILIVREGKGPTESWASRLSGGRGLGSRADVLLDESRLQVISLDRSLPALSDRRSLWEATYASYAKGERRSPPPYLDNELFDRPLFIMLDAYREFSGPRREQAPSADELLQDVLKHERTYWAQARDDLSLSIDERSMNQVAAVATLVSGAQRSNFEKALTSLAWLQDNPELLSRIADWWSAVYATERGVIRGVEPDIVGEYLVMRALGEQSEPRSPLEGALRAEQMSSLIESAAPSGRQRILRVLTRIANGSSGQRSEAARAVLSEVLSKHLNDFLPAAFHLPRGAVEYEGVGESAATTVASAVLASGQFQLVASESGPVSGPAQKGTEAMGAAIKIVRRQIEHVAEREFQAGRLSVERFAALLVWILRLELKAGALDQANRWLDRVRSLEPVPHRAVAGMLLELARARAKRDAEAERLLREALAELSLAGEGDSRVAFVVEHDLGDVASAHDDNRLAIERYERAFSGKKRVEGVAEADTITSFLALSWVKAKEDLDATLAQIDAVEREVVAAGGEEDQLERLREARAQAELSAGRKAARDRDLDEAEALFERARSRLEELGMGDARLAHVIEHDLGDVAAMRGDTELARERYRRALEGKRRTLGVDHPSTVTTVLAYADRVARDDVDGALAVLEEAVEQAKSGDLEQFDRLVGAWTGLLAGERRFGEAKAVAQSVQEFKLATETRRAIFEATADVSVYAGLPLISAMDSCMMSARILKIEDPRFLSLASRIGLLLVDLTAEVITAHIDGRELDGLEVDSEQTPDPTAAMRAIDRKEAGVIDSIMSRLNNVTDVGAIVAGAPKVLWEELQRAARDPLVASLQLGEPDPVAALADSPAVRRWLIQLAATEQPEVGDGPSVASLAALLSYYLCLRTEAATEPPLDRRALAKPLRNPNSALLDAERARLVADLQAAGHEHGQASDLVEMATVKALANAGHLAEQDKEPEEAEGIYEKALDRLAAAGRRDSEVAYGIEHDLGDVALARGKPGLAKERYEAALEGKRRLCGIGEQTTTITLLALLRLVAVDDFDAAMERLAEAEAELESAGEPAGQLSRVRVGGAAIAVGVAREAEGKGRLEEAEKLYRRALRQLEVAGEADSHMAHVVEHDLGDVAMAQGDLAAAIDRYRQALEGKRRLRGEADRSTQTTATSYAAARVAHAKVVLARSDPAAAREAYEELLEEAGEHPHLAEIGFWAERGLGELDADAGDPGATARLERALARVRELEGADGIQTIETAFLLAMQRAEDDLDGALATIDDMERELVELEATDETLTAVRAARPPVCANAGRVALRAGDLDAAEAAFERGVAFCPAGEGEDSVIRYVLEHDLGDVASARGDRDEALERYERALEGKRRLLGPPAPDTVTTQLRLLLELAAVDRGRARQRGEAALVELQAAGAEEQVARLEALLKGLEEG